MKFQELVNLLEQADLPPPAYVQQFDLSDRDKDILATLLVKEAGGERDYISGMVISFLRRIRVIIEPSRYV